VYGDDYMKRAFYGSICHNGSQGGAIILDDIGINFKCQKITIEEEYKNMQLKYDKISTIQLCRSILIFPGVQIYMKNGEQYKFIIFNRKKFVQLLEKMIKQEML
jgi:hypothetical protein